MVFINTADGQKDLLDVFDSLIIKEENHESERVRGFLLRRSDSLSQCKAKTAPKTASTYK